MRIGGDIVVDESKFFRILTVCSLLYLYLPVVLFNAGWLRWPYCIVLSGLNILVLRYMLEDDAKIRTPEAVQGFFLFPKRHLLVLFAGYTIWSLLLFWT